VIQVVHPGEWPCEAAHIDPIKGGVEWSGRKTRSRMEIFLLWIDELDDAVGVLCHLAPKILAFLGTVAALTGALFAVRWVPEASAAVLSLAS